MTNSTSVDLGIGVTKISSAVALFLTVLEGILICNETSVLTQVVRSALPDGSLLHIHFENDIVDCLKNRVIRSFNAEARWPLTTLSGPFWTRSDGNWNGSRQFVVPASFILIGSVRWVQESVLKYPLVKDGWNSSGLFIAVVPWVDVPEVEATLWTLWRELSIDDFTVLVPPTSPGAPPGKKLWQVITAFPYDDASWFCGRRKGPKTFRSWELDITRGNINNSIPIESVFPTKQPVNLGGCKLPVNLQYDANLFSPGYLIPEGYAMAMLDALTQFLGVVPYRMKAPEDQFDTTPGAPDWSWYDALTGLESGDVDVLVGQYLYTDWRYDKYASLGPHGVSYYKWYMPMPAPQFLPILPQLALPKTVVVFILLSVVTAILIMIATALLIVDYDAATHYTHLYNGVLYVWTMFVEQPLTMASLRGLRLPSHIIVLTCLVGFLNVNVVIKSVIVSRMSKPQVNKFIKSPRDLSQTGHVVVGVETPIVQTLIQASSDDAVRSLSDHTIECYLNYTDCTDQLERWNDFGVDYIFCMVCTEEMIKFSTAGRSEYTTYTLNEPLHRNIYGWYGRKMFPQMERANRLFMLLQQSGLQSLWAEALSKNLSAVHQWRSHMAPCLDGGACAIGIERAGNLFVLLALGFALSVTSFCVELGLDLCSKWKSEPAKQEDPKRENAITFLVLRRRRRNSNWNISKRL